MQRCYELNVVETENYFSALIRHCEVSTIEYIFEWDADEKDNEFSTMKRTKKEFEKFLKKEFQGYYIYDFETCNTMKLEKFNPVSEGGYLIFVPLEWHEFLNNWLEFSSSEEISTEEEEELNKLWQEKFPAFDLHMYYNYNKYEAFGEVLASYLD